MKVCRGRLFYKTRGGPNDRESNKLSSHRRSIRPIDQETCYFLCLLGFMAEVDGGNVIVLSGHFVWKCRLICASNTQTHHALLLLIAGRDLRFEMKLTAPFRLLYDRVQSRRSLTFCVQLIDKKKQSPQIVDIETLK